MGFDIKDGTFISDRERGSRLHSLDLSDEEAQEATAWLRNNQAPSRWTGLAQPNRNVRLVNFLLSPSFAWLTLAILIIAMGLREHQHGQQTQLLSSEFSDLKMSISSLGASVSAVSSVVHDTDAALQQVRGAQHDVANDLEIVSSNVDLLASGPLRHPEVADDLPNTQNVAFVSMFSETLMTATNASYEYNDDHYFIAMRMLTYQLLHAHDTRTRRSIPFIIMVTPDVTQAKRDQLKEDGAIIWPLEMITEGLDWMLTENYQVEWRDQLSKLRVFEMVQYDRILYIDGDTILMRCLDGIFDEDVFNNTATPVLHNPAEVKVDEAPMPKEYLVASQFETLYRPYPYPPTPIDCTAQDPTNMLNGGFILLKPDLQLAAHYYSIAKIPHRFNAWWMEQGLLWYVHRMAGNMPSQILPATWNTISANADAVAGRVASIHDKWWAPRAQYPPIQKYFMAIRWRMEAYFDLRKNYASSKFKDQKEFLGVDLTVLV